MFAGEEPDPSPKDTDAQVDEDDEDVIVENDTEEAGYKSDRSASDDESTDAVVDRMRNKDSSGYEESGEEEEGVSEISEGVFCNCLSLHLFLFHWTNVHFWLGNEVEIVFDLYRQAHPDWHNINP